MIGNAFKSTKCGDFVVVSKIDKLFLCRFVDTGFEVLAQSSQIKKGNVKDKSLPSLFGVGFIGSGSYKSTENGKPTKAYMHWHGIHRRCYDEKYHELYPSYIDCEVCEEWQEYQVFAAWYEENKPEEGGRWELDKDIIKSGNKIYSPLFCKLVRSSENNEKCRAKNFTFRSPNGDIVNIYNLKKFCDLNGLQTANMYKVLSGKYSNHKGWTRV